MKTCMCGKNLGCAITLWHDNKDARISSCASMERWINIPCNDDGKPIVLDRLPHTQCGDNYHLVISHDDYGGSTTIYASDDTGKLIETFVQISGMINMDVGEFLARTCG